MSRRQALLLFLTAILVVVTKLLDEFSSILFYSFKHYRSGKDFV